VLRRWFQGEVNAHPFNSVETFTKNLEREYESFVSKTNSLCSLVDMKKHMLGVNAHNWCLSPSDIADATSNDFIAFRDNLLESLREKRESNSMGIELCKPSQREDVLERLGCTAACECCGAICWLSVGHEKAEATKLHFTSHQPPGLHCVRELESNRLVCSPCSDWRDDQYFYHYRMEC
jgi:hypothetical protein